MSIQEEVQRGLRMFLDIAKAESPMEATALAAMLQESASRELLGQIGKLNSSTTALVRGSNKLFWLSWALTVLTVVLTFCTGVLVWLTYKLAFSTGGG